MARIRAAIVGATGYAGVQVLQLLENHPDVDVVAAASHSQAGKPIGWVYPHLADNRVLVDEGEILSARPDVVISALPHGESGARARQWLDSGAVVIDLGADFRLRQPTLYPKWYGAPHPDPELLETAVLGFPELHAAAIAEAQLIACPGCYSTAAVLALAPAAAAGLLDGRQVIVDAKSGVSGAGRGLSLNSHFAEVNESVTAYAVKGHRHHPEIDRELEQLTPGEPPQITFVPHLIPMTRGILATGYFEFDGDAEDLMDLYRDFYEGEPFIVLQDEQPATKQASGSNLCYVTTAVQGDSAVVTSALDNLIKGAAGQAVECLNLRFGLDRMAGLLPPARWP